MDMNLETHSLTYKTLMETPYLYFLMDGWAPGKIIAIQSDIG